MSQMIGWRGHDPRNMLILPTETVVDIAATDSQTVLLTASGILFIGQYNGYEKGRLEEVNLDCIINSIAIYKEKIIYVTKYGDVFSYCHNTKKTQEWHLVEPRKTCSHGKEEVGKLVRVKRVSAGVDHILFHSTEDEIWVQGKGPALGLVTNKTENEITNPTRVDYFKGRKILQAVAGAYFTVALVEALPPLDNSLSKGEDQFADMDCFVNTCDSCRKERGHKLQYDDGEKCPLGLGVHKDVMKLEFLSPTMTSTGIDDGSSKNSINQDDTDSGCLQYDSELSYTISQDETASLGLKVATKNDTCDKKPDNSSSGSFMEKTHDVTNGDSTSSSTGTMFSTDTAKQFFSRPLSWVTSSSLDHDQFNFVSDKFKYKYPIDSATEIIKENVANAANLVRTVGDKVGQLSRHFSSSDCVDEPLKEFCTELPEICDPTMKLTSCMRKSESFEGNTFPRIVSANGQRKTHFRTSSGEPNARYEQGGMFLSGKNCGEVEKNREKLIERGQEVLNSEVWAWGSSSKGQLGLGDHMHQTVPTNVSHLNHLGVVKIVAGSHHTACLTIDGKIHIWGSNFWKPTEESKNTTVTTPEELILPNCDIVRDIASGDDFLMAVSLDGSIYYIGKSENDETFTKNIQVSSQSPKHFSVLCSCQSVICTTEDSNTKVDSFIREEVKYLTQMKGICQYLISPLMAMEKNAVNIIKANLCNTPSSPNNILMKIHKTRQTLLQSFVSLTHLTASVVQKLWFDNKEDFTLAIPITSLVAEMQVSYSEYVTTFCDALAINGITMTTKEAETIIENALKKITPTTCDTDPSSNNVLSNILALPLERVGQYEKFLYTLRTDLAELYTPFTLDCLKDSHSQWKQLSTITSSNKIDAENTGTFWKNLPKLFETVGTPSRRLALHSKDVPINLQKGGRFFSNSFVLLSDLLVYNSYNSFVLYFLSTMWVESLPSHSNHSYAIHIVVPEDSFTLVCATQADKSKWLHCLQDAIKTIVRVPGEPSHSFSIAPPLVRNATYQFMKNAQYKDATYSGQWFCGKMDGEGSLVWPDGKRYIGQFRQNVYQGYGRLEELSTAGINVYEGMWKNGKLEGRGFIKYANGDLYVGFLRESRPHGHGELKKGNFGSEAASIYTGEWKQGVKQGYGVLDQIAKGEKYHGMWHNNNRHGLGMVATMNDVYYEGNFTQNKLTGQGLVILEDGTYFEGEVGPGGSCNGKGTMRTPGGDTLDGIFTGGWEEGVKVNAIMRKGIPAPLEFSQPKSFGKMSVPAHMKWTMIFEQCEAHLGLVEDTECSTTKIWDCLACFMEIERQTLLRSKGTLDPMDGVDKIFHPEQELTRRLFTEIEMYLEKASAKCVHPLGQLVKSLVNAFRSTYGGVVSHPRLLTYAVKEVESFTSRLYRIVKLLFPMLPNEGTNMIWESEEQGDDDLLITAASVIHPWILPPLYASLSPLYVKHHEKSDDQYWQRLLKWNKQSDIALMTFLGVEMRLWTLEGQNIVESNQSLSGIKDKHFVVAVEALQLLSTSFTPKDKLILIHDCGLKIGQEVTEKLGPRFNLSMDELLPIFLYVVVRARIQHLGAEIAFIRDLMDRDVCNGKLEHMFTTLEACYSYILNEDPTSFR